MYAVHHARNNCVTAYHPRVWNTIIIHVVVIIRQGVFVACISWGGGTWKNPFDKNRVPRNGRRRRVIIVIIRYTCLFYWAWPWTTYGMNGHSVITVRAHAVAAAFYRSTRGRTTLLIYRSHNDAPNPRYAVRSPQCAYNSSPSKVVAFEIL